MTALSSTFGMLTRELTNAQRVTLVTKLIPWAIRCGRNCKPLMNVYYEKYLNEPLSVVRKKLQFEKAPNI